MDIEERKGKMTASLQENVAYMNGRLAVDASFDRRKRGLYLFY